MSFTEKSVCQVFQRSGVCLSRSNNRDLKTQGGERLQTNFFFTYFQKIDSLESFIVPLSHKKSEHCYLY